MLGFHGAGSKLIFTTCLFGQAFDGKRCFFVAPFAAASTNLTKNLIFSFWDISPFDLLTIGVHGGTPGQVLAMKLKSYAAPKCHPILFDSSLNPLAVVYGNAYALSILCAIKAHAHVRSIPQKNPLFLFRAVHDSAVYLSRLIQRRTPHSEQALQPLPRLDFFVWLCLHAYLRCMELKPNQKMSAAACLLKDELAAPKFQAARAELTDITAKFQGILIRFRW